MKINNPNRVEYINRYNDIFTFTKVSSKEILWEGKFEYCSISMPNDYSKAFEKYKEQGGLYKLDEFIQRVHDYDYEKKDYVMGMEIVKLISSIPNKYSSIDPSGGPYIGLGSNMGRFSKIFKGKIVKDFEKIKTGFKIICE